MTSLTAVKPVAVDLHVDGEQVDDAVPPCEDVLQPLPPVVPRQRREEAHVTVVDAQRGHAAVQQASEGAQHRAVAAEHQAHVCPGRGEVVDQAVAEAGELRVLGRLFGGRNELQAEPLAVRGELGQGLAHVFAGLWVSTTMRRRGSGMRALHGLAAAAATARRAAACGASPGTDR